MQRIVFIPEIGEVTLSKRHGTTHLRLSINAAGKVRVGLPYWTPYQAGVVFAKSRVSWIKKHLSEHINAGLQDGDLIGKSHRISYTYNAHNQNIATRITSSQIKVITALSINDQRVQTKIQSAGERALKAESEHLLPQRLKFLAQKHGFNYRQVKVRKLTARWGSCSNNGVITLSFYLLQLPWRLIDYVLLHELVHTKHMHHGPGFWDDFERVLPNAKALRKEIRPYKPTIQAYKHINS